MEFTLSRQSGTGAGYAAKGTRSRTTPSRLMTRKGTRRLSRIGTGAKKTAWWRVLENVTRPAVSRRWPQGDRQCRPGRSLLQLGATGRPEGCGILRVDAAESNECWFAL